MSTSSFIVEVPSLFTKSTQIASRCGNTILTGNEQIQGNMLINGSLTLNGSLNDTTIKFNDLDISNLIVHEDSTLNKLRVTSTFEVEHGTLLKGTLNVNGHSSLNDLEVFNDSILNDVSINGTLYVVDDSRLDSLFCNTLEVYNDSSFNVVNINTLTVSNHTLLDSISCETLEANDISVNYAYMNDISCLYLDISNSLIVNGSLNVNGQTNLQNISGNDISCQSLNVIGHTLFQDSISYQTADRSLLTTDMSAILWIVSGESVGRLDLSHNINHYDVREGNIFGKKYWASKNDGYLEVENVYVDANEWTISFAFGVVNPYKSGTLFYENSKDIIKLDGPNLYVYEDSRGLIIPSFSVLTIVRHFSSYTVYINGIQEYVSTVDEYPINTNSLNFIYGTVGIQLLATAFWDRKLNVSEIEELTLEVLT